MNQVPDDLDRLVSEVRKTISDNRLFLEKLEDEEAVPAPGDEADEPIAEDEFEEL